MCVSLVRTTLNVSAGTLRSPNYPGLYDNDLDYWVHVRSAPDTRLVFVFASINLEYQNDCLYDFIEVRILIDSEPYFKCDDALKRVKR